MNNLAARHKLIIFISALVIRALYVVAQEKFNLTVGSFVSGDSDLYLEIARNLLAGDGFRAGNSLTAFVSPGFPLFLAGCLAVFGDNTFWTSLVQCVLSSAACVFIATSAAAVFNRRIGIVAGMISVFYYELILWTTGQILTEPLYFFLLSAAVCAVVRAVAADKFSPSKFALAGLLFGLTALVRPIALPIAAALAVSLLASGLLKNRRLAISAFVFIGACLLTMQPWGIRNYFAVGGYALASTEGGHVFWLGNNAEFDLYEHPEMKNFGGYTTMFKPPPEIRRELAGKNEVEQSSVYNGFARQHIIEHPAQFLTRVAYKNWNMWRPTFSNSSRVNRFVSYTFYPLLLLTSLTGIVIVLKREFSGQKFFRRALVFAGEPAGLLIVFLLAHLALHSVINGEIRFRVPLWTALIPFAAFAAVTVAERFKTSKTTAGGKV